MSGAYVAKPAADTTPAIPPGWNPAWPFPGVNPPGYVNSYTIPVTAPTSVTIIVDGDDVHGDAEVSASLRDYLVYPTTEPEEGSVIRWTATIDGEPIALKFSGGAQYLDSLESSYSESDDLWGAAASIVFQLSEAHDGKTIVLTATTEVGGIEVSGSSEIEANLLASFSVQVDIVCAPISSTGRQCGIAVNYLYESEVTGSASAYFRNSSGPYNRTLQQDELFDTVIAETETGWRITATFPRESSDTSAFYVSCWVDPGFWVLPVQISATCSDGEETLWSDERTHSSGSNCYLTISRKTGALLNIT